VLDDAGHSIYDDEPVLAASTIATFMTKHFT